ncbi:hypothetical protein SSS_09997 [Sarcoptes scabiei]|nr:hypothetical protein SSS_09997 [Sarcoptes scabiei]
MDFTTTEYDDGNEKKIVMFLNNNRLNYGSSRIFSLRTKSNVLISRQCLNSPPPPNVVITYKVEMIMIMIRTMILDDDVMEIAWRFLYRAINYYNAFTAVIKQFHHRHLFEM